MRRGRDHGGQTPGIAGLLGRARMGRVTRLLDQFSQLGECRDVDLPIR